MIAFIIIFSLFQFCQNVKGPEEASFMVSAGKRLTPAFDAFIVESKITCCAKCSRTNWCLSANFNNSTRICELVPLPALAVQSYASMQENWNAYSTTGMVCRFVVVVVLLFYVHGKHLRSCRDGQLTSPHFSWAGLDLLSG